MDNYIKVYTKYSKGASNADNYVISAGHSLISKEDHNVIRRYEKDNYLIIYIRKGNMFFYDDDNSYKILSSGSVVIFAPEKTQRYRFSHSPITENYWAHFTCSSSLLTALDLCSNSHLVFNIGEADKIFSLWDDLIAEIQLSNYASDIMANALFLQVLTHVSRAVYKIENPKNSLVFNQLTPAITSMYGDFSENKPNTYYASLCNMSESSFYHLFAKTFNTTPNKFLNDIRLRTAENLLVETNYPLEKIAELTGYATLQYFSKKFTEKHGVPPLKYRQNAIGIKE